MSAIFHLKILIKMLYFLKKGLTMSLRRLEDELNKVLNNAQRLNFCDLIRNSRLALGLKLQKAAEHIGILPSRLKNLECGNFNVMPSEIVFVGIARLYDMKMSLIEDKAREFLEKKKEALKTPKESKQVTFELTPTQQMLIGKYSNV